MRAVLRKELRDAVRSRWLIGYAVALGVLATVAALAGRTSSAGLDLQAYGRTTATLTNLCLLLAPLIALAMGGLSIAGERDRGTLEHLLAQPLERRELLLGKYFGLLVALSGATVLGFIPAIAGVGLTSGPARLLHAALFPMLAILLIAAMLAVGLWISVASRSGVQAQGAAIVVWFLLVLLYDLLLMGTLLVRGLGAGTLAAMLLLNPVDAARVLAVLALEPDLQLLGPAGALLVDSLSRSGAAGALVGALLVWTLLPLWMAVRRFRLPSRSRRRVEERYRAPNLAPTKIEEVET